MCPLHQGPDRSSLVNFTSEKRDVDTFCVLAPALREPVSCFKTLKSRDLRQLANKVHQRQGRGEKLTHNSSSIQRLVRNMKGCVQSARAPWKPGTSTAPRFVSLVRSERKRAMNSFDCKSSTLELTPCCSATHTTA